MVRDHGHVTALNTEAMKAVAAAVRHRTKVRISPGPATQAAAVKLRGTEDRATAQAAGAVVIDLARYAAAAERRNTLA